MSRRGIHTPVHLLLLLLLLSLDAPTVFVSTILISPQPSLIIYLNESDPIPTYFCSADGYPEPSLIWKFNGGGLPNGIISQV